MQPGLFLHFGRWKSRLGVALRGLHGHPRLAPLSPATYNGATIEDARAIPSPMSWTGKEGGRRGYHHGNLREALITAALDLIGQKGPAGFTFAEAARHAGVSAAAPYRHFRDRDALMADVARRGFELFAARLERAWDGGKPAPLPALERMDTLRHIAPEFDELDNLRAALARLEPKRD